MERSHRLTPSSNSGQDELFIWFVVSVILHLIMDKQKNNRGHDEYFVRKSHLRLKDLKKEARRFRLEKKNRYLFKENIPNYPKPEFYVSSLKHDTDRGGLCWIWKDKGFKDPHGGLRDPDRLPLVWWSLAVGPQEIESAEERLLKKTFKRMTRTQSQIQHRFLEKFATSPAFSRRSRMGSYRFTLNLETVLTAYSQQFCSGEPPVMRVYKTSLYKQEVQYAVLVHSPTNHKLFNKYPLLPSDDPDAICIYRDGYFIWRAQAMCKTHSYRRIRNPDENLMDAQAVTNRPEFYVWDNVAIALHVDKGQVLKFDSDHLKESLSFCLPEEKTVTPKFYFDHSENAEITLQSLWPEYILQDVEPSSRQDFMEEVPMSM